MILLATPWIRHPYAPTLRTAEDADAFERSMINLKASVYNGDDVGEDHVGPPGTRLSCGWRGRSAA
jgi:hypothetical protein